MNLAPPGPPGQDWRDEIDVPLATNFGPPGSSFDHGAPAEQPLLGYAPPEDDAPLPDFGPPPTPEAEAVGVDIGFADPDPRFGMPAPVGEPTPLTTSFPDAYEPSPYDTGRVTTGGDLTSFGFDDDPMTPPPIVDPPVPAFGAPSFEPAPFEPEPVAAPGAYQPAHDPVTDSFAAPVAAVASAPVADFGLTADDRFTPPPAMAYADDPLPPPAVAFADDPMPPPPVDVAPPPAPVAPAIPAPIAGPVVDATPPAIRATDPMPDPVPAPGGAFADIPRAAIRPPTPTRIPAAKPEQGKSGDAKAMLARIAALRSDKD